MNIFNQSRKLQELRKEHDALVTVHMELGNRVVEQEKALIEMQAAHNEDMKEIRERLDMPQRRKPTMKPWSVLRSVAEKGEQFMKEKQNA